MNIGKLLEKKELVYMYMNDALFHTFINSLQAQGKRNITEKDMITFIKIQNKDREHLRNMLVRAMETRTHVNIPV